MSERGDVLGRTEAPWIDARLWVPDTTRLVIGLVPNKVGKLRPVPCRFSGGAWRFLSPKDKSRTKRNVRVWMDIPWWNSREQTSNPTTPPPVPAGAKARSESEAEAQAEIRANRIGPREETGLSQAEADFDGELK